MSQWQEAAADFARAIELGTEEAFVWHAHALAQVASGDITGYRGTCARALYRFGGTREAEVAALLALNVVLIPDSGADPSQAVQLAETAVANRIAYFGQNWFYLHILALAQYRAGQPDAALQTARESVATNPEGKCGVNWLLLAIVYQRLGHAAEARRWRNRGLRWNRADRRTLHWATRLRYEFLCREAGALIPSDRP
jgi:tetratricopeptide (TPR) repeat protein